MKSLVRDTIINLIENEDVSEFYVGYNGNFDIIVFNQLRQLSEKYPIKYSVVLTNIPVVGKYSPAVIDCSLLPDGIELVHPRLAICYRNKWMLDHSQFVVTYVSRSFGGAARYRSLSLKEGKNVIDLYSK